MNTVSMIGMGALGILFGHPLSQTLGDNFRMIADSQRIARYSTTPTTSNGEVCQFSFLPPNAPVPPSDLVIVAVKSTGLEQAMDDIASQVGENTVIISLLNGISSEEQLESRWPGQVVYAISIGMDATRVGQALIFHNMGKIQIGERDGSTTSRLQALGALFSRCSVPYELCDDILYKQWHKMIVNVGVNQATAVFDVPYGGIQVAGEPQDMVHSAMRELIAVGNARGIPLTESDIIFWDNLLSNFNPQGMPSMRQDVLAKRPTEKELFSGTVCRLGRELGIPTPVNDWFYQQLTQIEAAY